MALEGTQIVNIDLIPLAYIGPDTLLPLGSFLAGFVGIVLVFSRSILRFFRRLLRLDRGTPEATEVSSDAGPTPPTAI